MRTLWFREKSLGLVVALAMLTSGLAVAADVAVAPLARAVSNIAMYRLYNPTTGEHFFTSDQLEVTVNVGKGWSLEGIGWYSSGSLKIYRQYNPKTGQHNYTADPLEIQVLTTQQGWTAENNGNPVWYGMAAGVPATARLLAVNRYKQEQSNWCWAASTQMVIMYVQERYVSQCNIVLNATMGLAIGSCPNIAASDQMVRDALDPWGLSLTYSSGILPITTIKSEIDASRPIEYDYQYAGTLSGHVVVINGYSYASIVDLAMVYWNDPWDGLNKHNYYPYLASNSIWTAHFSLCNIS